MTEEHASRSSMKWTVSLKMDFHKASNPAVITDPAIVFLSEPNRLLDMDTELINVQTQIAFNSIMDQVETFSTVTFHLLSYLFLKQLM